MMRILIIVISFLTFSCNSKEKNNDINIIKNNDNHILENKANKLKEAYFKNNYWEFFKLFPDDFDTFLKLYGFNDEIGEKVVF